jgi:hypothetical protein
MDTHDNQHPLMLDIAREAIRQRAASDGYEASGYDAEHDPEGYIVSLLNALCQWCHVHGMDWERELAQARELFEADLEQLGQPATRPHTETLRCPACLHTGTIDDFRKPSKA